MYYRLQQAHHTHLSFIQSEAWGDPSSTGKSIGRSRIVCLILGIAGIVIVIVGTTAAVITAADDNETKCKCYGK